MRFGIIDFLLALDIKTEVAKIDTHFSSCFYLAESTLNYNSFFVIVSVYNVARSYLKARFLIQFLVFLLIIAVELIFIAEKYRFLEIYL